MPTTLLGTTVRNVSSIDAWSPSVLFAQGEPGTWYDPSDVSVNWRRNLSVMTTFELLIGSAGSQSPNGTGWSNFFATGGTRTYVASSANPGSFAMDIASVSSARNVIGWTFTAASSTTYTVSFFIESVSSVTGTVAYAEGTLGTGGSSNTIIAPSTTGRVQYTFTTGTGAGSVNVRFGIGAAGNESGSIRISGVQVEVGALTDYQQIVTPEITYLASVQPQPILYTTSTGTTPVTAVEQAVGLILDKSRGLVLGPELVTNGDFSNGTAGWTAGNAPTLSVGASGVTIQNNGAISGLLYQGLTLVGGRTYQASVKITYGGTGFARCEPSTANPPTSVGGNVINASASGTYSFVFVASATLVYIVIGNRSDNNASQTYDNISVREIAGTHAIQPGSTSRMVLRNRYNRITHSEQFDNAAWTKAGTGTGSAPVVTANAAVAPDGTTTADLIVFDRGAGNTLSDQSSVTQAPATVAGIYTQYVWLKAATAGDVGKQLALRNVGAAGYGVVTLTADWVQYTRTETRAANAWDLVNRGTITTSNSVSAHVWGADFRSANDTIYPYQRIAAATDYDSTQTEFPLYLACDGSDDSLYTAANLDLSSTDKVTVFAGVTKLSDAAFGVIAELTANAVSNNGGFYLVAGGGAGSVGALYGCAINGSASYAADFQTFTAPVTNAITQQMDIALATGADELTLRADGIAATRSTTAGTNAGTGNFASAVLNIGRRNNASLPLNGRIYQLIVRGAASSAAEVTNTERWIAGKMGRSVP